MINPGYPDEKDDYYNDPKAFLWELVPDGPNLVMDLGCASGRLGQRLLELNKAYKLVGVELFEPAARQAMKFYENVYIADIEDLCLDYDKHFDIVICGDILEHLKDPLKTLTRIHKWLKDDGLLICSFPNIRYWRIIRDLMLRGEWKYTTSGIMDQTHLRFFTVRSFKRILNEASFDVVRVNIRLPGGPRQAMFNRVTLGLFKEFLGFQIVLSARKHNHISRP
jgi:SAM-dependent methyltransferase